jgi:hypothetical protein
MAASAITETELAARRLRPNFARGHGHRAALQGFSRHQALKDEDLVLYLSTSAT